MPMWTTAADQHFGAAERFAGHCLEQQRAGETNNPPDRCE
jgi:hypothetical protein